MQRFLIVLFSPRSVRNVEIVFRKLIGPCKVTHLKLNVCSYGGRFSIISQDWKYSWISGSEKPLGETSSSIVKSMTRRLWKCSRFRPKSVILSISRLLALIFKVSSMQFYRNQVQSAVQIQSYAMLWSKTKNGFSLIYIPS